MKGSDYGSVWIVVKVVRQIHDSGVRGGGIWELGNPTWELHLYEGLRQLDGALPGSGNDLQRRKLLNDVYMCFVSSYVIDFNIVRLMGGC